MLSIRICNMAGAVIAEGTCSDSGYFPPALASIYNASLNLDPARNLEHFDPARTGYLGGLGLDRTARGRQPSTHSRRTAVAPSARAYDAATLVTTVGERA